jgi:hypothetical protein
MKWSQKKSKKSGTLKGMFCAFPLRDLISLVPEQPDRSGLCQLHSREREVHGKEIRTQDNFQVL